MRSVLSRTSSLLEALQSIVPGASNRTLRQMLRQERVRVNGAACRLPGETVQPGDVVEVSERARRIGQLAGIDILFEDDHILVVRKPVGLLSVSTAHEKERTLSACLRAYVRAKGRRDIFVVHRLDKFASGILVFARTEAAREKLRASFRRHDVQRKYWAIVEDYVATDAGTIRSRLAEDRSLRMRSTTDVTRGKPAVTHFRVLRRLSNLTALEVTLETGRKNQIRAHLSEMGHPIVGDRAYGSTVDPLGRLGLHAFSLGFRHPMDGSPMTFSTSPPPEFVPYLPEEPKFS